MRASATVLAIGLLATLALCAAPASRAEEARGLQLPGGVTVGDDLVGQRTALCIGINGYRDERYGPLRYAASDARAMANVLAANGYAVTLMVDDDPDLGPERIPTYRNLDDAIYRICKASRSANDTLLITFAGHGDVIDGQSVFLPLDVHEEGRVLTVGALFDALGRARAAKKLVVLDACRSGKRDGARLLQSGFLKPLAGRGGLVVISGCGADQSSFEDEALGMGRLTKTIVDGLGGAAFEERHEFLFGHELWGYIESTFHEQGWHTSQSPTMFGTWDARVRFDLARRDVEPPPAITDADRAMYDLAMKSAFDKVEADDLTACIEYCVTALRILDGDADALALRAFAYAMLGFYDRAQKDVDAVLAEDPNNVYALVIRCFVGDALGHFEVYDRDGTRALLLFRAHPERWVDRLPPKLASYVWVAYAVALGRFGSPVEELLAAYDRVLGIPGASPKAAGWAHTFRGELLFWSGRREEGLAELAEAMERAAGDLEVLANARVRRGRFQVLLGHPEEAARDLDWVLENAAEYPYALGLAWIGKAELAWGAGNVEEALAAYERVRTLGSRVGDLPLAADFGRARILAHLGRNEEAIAAYTQVLGPGWVAPGDRAWALAERGAVQVVSGTYEPALRDLDASLERRGAPWDARCYAAYWKGIALQRLGRFGEAAEAFRGVVEVRDPPGALAGEAADAEARRAMCRAALRDGGALRDRSDEVLAAAPERWHHPWNMPDASVVDAWLRAGAARDEALRVALEACRAKCAGSPLAARASRILEALPPPLDDD